MKLILVIAAMLIINTGRSQNIYKDMINDSSTVIPIQINEHRIYDPEEKDTIRLNDSTKIILPTAMRLLQIIQEKDIKIEALQLIVKTLSNCIDVVLKYGGYSPSAIKEIRTYIDLLVDHSK